VRHKIGGVACISGWLPFNLPLPPPVLPKSRQTGGYETTTSWGVNATGAAGDGSLDNRSMVNCLRVPGHMKDVPIWLMHGSEDDVIPVEAANFSAQRLSQLGFSNVTVHEYHGRQHKYVLRP
jgi:alpha-beta hydrolase superfamily lysophospholipase